MLESSMYKLPDNLLLQLATNVEQQSHSVTLLSVQQLLLQPDNQTSSPTSFSFPERVQIGERFASVQGIRVTLTSQIQNRGLSFSTDDYYNRYYPTKQNWNLLRMTCRKCPSAINFKRVGGEIVLKSIVNLLHDHRCKKKRPRNVSVLKAQDEDEWMCFEPSTNPQPQIPSKKPQTRQRTKRIPKSEECPIVDINEVSSSIQIDGSTHLSKKDAEEKIPNVPNNRKKEMSRKAQLKQTIKDEVSTVLDEKEFISREYIKSDEAQSHLQLIKMLEPINNRFETISEWMNERSYKFFMKQGASTQTPQLLLWVSPNMQRNYQRYGDLLHVEIVHDILRTVDEEGKSYRVVAFGVEDAEGRAQFVGMAVLSDLSAASGATLVRQFLIIQGKDPKSIATADQSDLVQGLRDLTKEKAHSFEHLLSPRSVIKEVAGRIHGNRTEVSQALDDLHTAMHSRDLEDHRRAVTSLTKNPATQNIIQKLLKKKHNTFYCQSGEAYWGSGRSVGAELVSILRREFQQSVSIVNFVRGIDNLEIRCSGKTASDDDLYSEEACLQLESRFLEMSKLFGRIAVVRFVENYIAGLRSCVIHEQPEATDQETFMVCNKNQNCIYVVNRNRCECKEFERTGVACPHLIMVTFVDGGKPFTDLISNRWRRQTKSVD